MADKKLTSGITGTITAPGATDAIPITDNSGAAELKKITWSALTAKVIPHSLITAKGDIIAGTGSAAVDNLAVGTDLYGLHADSSQTTGLIWTPDAYGLEHVSAKTEISNNSTEQTLWSKAVTWPLYVGSDNRMLKLTALLTVYNNTGGNVIYTYKFKYGTAVVTFNAMTVGTGTSTWPIPLTGWVVGNGATNAQITFGVKHQPAAWVASYGGTDPGNAGGTASSQDSTGAITMAITCTMDTASANAKNSVLFSRLEGLAP